jgi:hypothetical protein
MKKIILFFSAIILLLGVNSCGKSDSSTDGGNVVIYKVPVDMAAEYVGLAFCNAAVGINMHLENAAIFTAKDRSTFDSLFTMKKMDSAAAVKYQYNFEYNFQSFTTAPPYKVLSYNGYGSFSSKTMTSQDNQTGNSWTFTTLDQPQFTVNGNGNSGGQQYSISDDVFFNSNVKYTFKDVKMDRVTHLAAGGVATISINGNGPANISFSYTGSLTFTGGRMATLVLGGSTYTLNLLTGVLGK